MKFIQNKRDYILIKELMDNVEDFKDGKPEPISLTGMDIDDLNDIKIDIFEIIKYKVMQVAYGYANSLVITGQSGLGKTHDVEQALDISRKEYESISGGISTPGLFETLFLDNGKILLFDDCDSVFDNPESINLLKAALDSKVNRRVSRKLKTHFNTSGMTTEDIIGNYNGDISMVKNKHLFDIKNKGKMPKSFIYTGRIIFISNLKGNEIDPTIITRASAHVDVNLTHEEVIDRMNMVMKAIRKDVPLEKKERVLKLLDYLVMNYETRHPLSIRGLVNAIDTMIANDIPTTINGKVIPLWQILIKQDMVGKHAVRRKN